VTGERNGSGLIARLDFFETMSDAGIFSGTALRVAFRLLYRHMNGVTGRCDPAVETLATELGLDRRNVQRAIRELEASGWWQVVGRGRGAGRGHTSSYRPILEKGAVAENASPVTHFEGEKMRHFRSENASSETPKPIRTEKRLPPIVPPRGRESDFADAFEVFWAAYPPRSPHSNPKKPALNNFAAALRRGADPADIVRGAENYALCAKQHITDRKFIAQATTWLSQERWKDHRQPPAEVPPRKKHSQALF
jgi:hypothetical protein